MPRKRRLSETMPEGWYEAQLARQDGHCAICPNTPKSRRLHIDHDHQTGKVRGLLCYPCNRLLLGAGVRSDRLRAAADYLDSEGVLTEEVSCFGNAATT
jgi:hypothetical protein